MQGWLEASQDGCKSSAAGDQDGTIDEPVSRRAPETAKKSVVAVFKKATWL